MEQPEARDTAMRQRLQPRTPADSQSAQGDGARLRVFALRATGGPGKSIAETLGQPLAAHEEREFDDGEHKARPLETIAGTDVYVVQSLHGGPAESAIGKQAAGSKGKKVFRISLKRLHVKHFGAIEAENLTRRLTLGGS